jgi:hypothetical protein
VCVLSDTEPEPTSVAASVGDFALAFTDFFLLRFDMGSKEIVRGFGGCMGAISTVSTSDTFLSQEDVAAIEVGLVIVEVIR